MSKRHTLRCKDLTSLHDLAPGEVEIILDLADELKEKQKNGVPHRTCEGKILGMIFQKPSTRTRVSFQAGIYQLGGMGMFLSGNDLQLGKSETVEDTAQVMSRFVDCLMARVFGHDDILTLAKYATIPVINGLSDLLHPCQVLADLQTLREKKGALKGLKLAYFGDGNNVAHSLLFGGAAVGMHVAVATPKGYEVNPDILKQAQADAASTGAELTTHNDPAKAAAGADALYTDVWASMGQEDEAAERDAILRPYQLNSELLSHAKDDAIVLHCLPAHREDEITSEVIDGPASVVFDQAENRLHAQKAVMTLLMGTVT